MLNPYGDNPVFMNDLAVEAQSFGQTLIILDSILGISSIIEPLQFNLQTTPTADSPVFTLICISTGGPATTATWIRDGAAAIGVTSQTVVDQAAITYHSTLIVTGRQLGNYQCSITNDRTTRPTTASLNVTG